MTTHHRPPVRWGVTMFVVAWVLIVVVSAFSLIRMVNGGSLGLDYRAFHAAGSLVADGDGGVIYDPDSPEFSALSDVGFVYPPWIAVAFVPLSLVSIPIGFALWTGLSVFILVAGLRSVGAWDWRFMSLAALSLPFVFAAGLGQSTFLLVGVLAFGVGRVITGRRVSGGVLLGLASWKPHLLGGFVILAVGRTREWARSVAVGAVVAAVLVATSQFLIPGSVRGWIALVGGSFDELASAVLEASLPGMVSLAISGSSSVGYVVTVIVMLVVVPLAVRAVRASPAGVFEVLTFSLCLGMVLVPHLVIYDSLVLLIPLGALVRTRYRRDVVAVGTILAFCLTVGPWSTLAQLRTFDRAIDLSTLGVIAAVVVSARWVTQAEPVLVPSRPEADAVARG